MKTNILILLLAITLGACNNSGNDAKKETQTSNESKMDSSNMAPPMADVSKNDSSFLVFAADVGNFEVKAGQLAEENSHDIKVKNFAAMMVKDHTAMGIDVSKLAAQKNITLPADLGSPLKDEWAKLDSLKGDQFDKEYADFNVKGHQEAISKFQQVADSSSNYSPEVKQLAAAALPKLKEHKQHSDMLESKVLAERK